MKTTITLFKILMLCILLNGCTTSVNIYEEVFQLEKLPELKSDWQAFMFSSYDRKGGNDDGFNGTYSKLRMENGNSVLAEYEGAGYISRIWFTHSEHKRDGLLNLKNEHIKIYIDDKNNPAIDIPLETVFTGETPGFPKGLVGKGLGGWYCYVPIPFSKYCRIEVEGDGVRFYQINLQKYTGTLPVENYNIKNSEKVNQLLKAEGEKWIGKKIAEDLSKTEQSLIINPFATEAIEISKKGQQLTELQIQVEPEYLNSVLNSQIQIYWDNEETPSVNVPVNMFFAIPDSGSTHQSMMTGYKNGILYNKFPMPFNKNARIEIEAADSPVQLKVGYKLEKQSEDDWGYFSAWYNEGLPIEDTTKNYLLLDCVGTGNYVGTFLMTEAQTHGDQYLPVWLEGDEIFTSDGEMLIHGTGTEDYFNCGWYSVPERLNNPGSFPLHGFPKFEMGETGYASAYRWHLTDPVPFNKSINVTLEHGTNNTILANYKSVAFYYLSK